MSPSLFRLFMFLMIRQHSRDLYKVLYIVVQTNIIEWIVQTACTCVADSGRTLCTISSCRFMFRSLPAFEGGREVTPWIGRHINFMCHLLKVVFRATHLTRWAATSCQVTPVGSNSLPTLCSRATQPRALSLDTGRNTINKSRNFFFVFGYK